MTPTRFRFREVVGRGAATRRDFLQQTAAGLGGALLLPGAPAVLAQVSGGSDPFTLGVASGDPDEQGVVLWTRLAPEPLALDGLGGMKASVVPVRWELAADERFSRVVRRGELEALPQDAHSIHVEVDGLDADTAYFYRFECQGHRSPAGRTRTAPAPDAMRAETRLGVVSCASRDAGYFTAYRLMADEQPDLVLHLGDYIYENAARAGSPRPGLGGETRTLADYRLRYAFNKTDPDLQYAHAAAPWVVVWDDHEIVDNWASDYPRRGLSPAEHLVRMTAAAKAYYEAMPLRRSARPAGRYTQLYRTLRWGQLATFYVLDTRQFRSVQGCGDGTRADCAARLDPARSILGPVQEAWLAEQSRLAETRWDVLAQQVFFANFDRTAGPGESYAMDKWSGYVPSRDRVLDMFGGRDRQRNLMVLTGDEHAHFAGDLRRDWKNPESPIVGSELVGSSITSGGDGADRSPAADMLFQENPHLRYHSSRRGYIACTVTPTRWEAHFRILPYVTRPGAPRQTGQSFVIEAGRPGLTPA